MAFTILDIMLNIINITLAPDESLAVVPFKLLWSNKFDFAPKTSLEGRAQEQTTFRQKAVSELNPRSRTNRSRENDIARFETAPTFVQCVH
jgi:hypothetical protein